MVLQYLARPLVPKYVRYILLGASILTLFFVMWTYHDYSLGSGSSLLHSQQPTEAVSAGTRKSLQSILNSTLGFQQVLAVNLPERTDHRDGLVLAGAVSNIAITFVEGVHGEGVKSKTLPSLHRDDLSPGIIGSWRAHVNTLSRIVEEGWSTALIIEDDVDWDIRLKSLLQEFAVSSNYLLQLNDKSSAKMRLEDIRLSAPPRNSPYGNDWDVIWLGHCGMDIPNSTSLVTHEKDQTVPEVKHLRTWDEDATSPLKDYPLHTRLVMRQKEGVCSLAYAVSQSGARKLLYRVGLQRLNGAFDIMLRQFCEGTNGEEPHVCLSVLPQLFDHHRRAGPKITDSDISPGANLYRKEAYTYNIRQSVRINMAQILSGDADFVDQWPDSEIP